MAIIVFLTIDTKVNLETAQASYSPVMDLPMDPTQYLNGNGIWSSLTPSAMGISTGTSGQYFDGTLALKTFPTIPAAQIQSDWNESNSSLVDFIKNKPSFGTVSSVGLTSSDFSISGSPITSTGSFTANLNTSGVTAGTYNSSYIVNSKGIVTGATNASFNSAPGRVFSTTGTNNTFTISSTKNARVHYTVNFSIALLAAASNAVVALDYSTDGGTTWTTVSDISQVYSVAITLTNNIDNILSGEIPAGALVRIYRSSNTNATVTLGRQQEIIY